MAKKQVAVLRSKKAAAQLAQRKVKTKQKPSQRDLTVKDLRDIKRKFESLVDDVIEIGRDLRVAEIALTDTRDRVTAIETYIELDSTTGTQAIGKARSNEALVPEPERELGD